MPKGWLAFELNVLRRLKFASVILPFTNQPHLGAYLKRWNVRVLANDLTLTGWQNVGYNDTQAGWESGLAGLSSFGEEAGPGFELRNFTLNAQTNGGPTTIYFRTHFNFPGSPTGATLRWAGAVDDGAVFYVNGVEAGRIRMTNTQVFFTNQASASSPETTNVFHPAEGPFLLSASNLVSGDNVLAVEVHQSGANSSDVVLSIQLIAEIQNATAPVQGPRLRISLNPATGAVTVSWTGAGILQQTTELQSSGTVWTDVAGNPNPYVFTPPAGSNMRFFSLRQ